MAAKVSGNRPTPPKKLIAHKNKKHQNKDVHLLLVSHDMTAEATLNFCKQENIRMNSWLEQQLKQDNQKPFLYTSYAVQKLQAIPGVKDLLKQTLDPPNPINELPRAVHNSLLELHGLYFISAELKLRITRVEAGKVKVLSPSTTGNKSCDVLATDGTNDIYFECKDHSSEIVKTTPNKTDPSFFDFPPSFGDTAAIWIGYMCRDADEKGANVLLCKVPRWIEEYFETREELDNWWIHEYFEVLETFGPRDHKIKPPFAPLSSNLTDVYILSLGHDDSIRLRLH